jgi:hypothetical protein
MSQEGLIDRRLLTGRRFEHDPAKQADDPEDKQEELQPHEPPKRHLLPNSIVVDTLQSPKFVAEGQRLDKGGPDARYERGHDRREGEQQNRADQEGHEQGGDPLLEHDHAAGAGEEIQADQPLVPIPEGVERFLLLLRFIH